ncbi:unnamed protein product [Penicillium olsonii]|uniref:Uncharacterized protein n=1 Tax=Penicillium olsonii TaxID=99116 RepID=A0A9W4MNH5_PENOL|nr:unnamed protein product [Penicillium olsonii]
MGLGLLGSAHAWAADVSFHELCACLHGFVAVAVDEEERHSWFQGYLVPSK